MPPVSLGTVTITAMYLGSTAISSAFLGNTEVFGSFNPSSLFAASEPGVWYDPSDLTTLFQDTAGTTPVTTAGQTVALALDKSRGAGFNGTNFTGVVGSELVTNGTFDANVSGWLSETRTTISWVGGELRGVTISTHTSYAYTDISTIAGKTYLFAFTTRVGSGQNMIATAWNGAFGTALNNRTLTTPTSNTTSYLLFQAIGTTTRVGLRPTAPSTFFLDNISVREVPGNHATQATAASRPTYAIVPSTGRRNLLLATDTMATQSRTVTAVAHTLSFTGTGTVTLTGASTAGPLVGTGAGNRVSLTFTPTAASLTLTVSGSVTLAQLEIGSAATAYQRVGSTAFDVTEAGVASLSYLSFDGVDDFLITPTITPNIDKAQVFAGVRKLSDAASGMLAEMSTTSASNNGTISVFAPTTTTANYFLRSRGTTAADATTPLSFAAPTTNVLAGLGDISGDNSALRVNGTQVVQTTTDQGTGNYLAYPLYIGRRAGTSLPLNGHLYSLIVRFGANLSAGTITSAERWVGGKTGITL